MSGTHSPAKEHPDEPRVRTTRTVAIIKNHALEHRLTIERRIEEASLEIVKERQMEFDQDSDQDFLHELFGNDTPALFEGPVWVYVLERRRAVEVWNALMGEEDPDRARELSPNSLRAVFGVNLAHNALMGSPDAQIAEDQIACLFQSSPPFPAQDLSFDGEVDEFDGAEHALGNGLVLSPSSSGPSFSHSPRVSQSGRSRQSSSATSSAGSKKGGVTTPLLNGNGKVPFKARPMPRTTLVPDIAPRTTRASALRAGVAVSPAGAGARGPRVAPTKEEMKQVFLDVPGHKRSSTIAVASTAPPAVAPRMTRAASLRLGQKVPSPVRPKARPVSAGGRDGAEARKNSFEGVPGHKRRETITVASVAAPTVAPRLNKSSELRAKKEGAPPSSFMFRPPTTPKTPGALSRTTSQSSLTPSRPSSSMASLTSNATPGGRFSSLGRAASTSAVATIAASQNENDVRPVMPPRPPSIEPRSNRSALLRAKMQNGAPPSAMPVKKFPAVTRRSTVAV